MNHRLVSVFLTVLLASCSSYNSKLESSVRNYRDDAQALLSKACGDGVDCSGQQELVALRLHLLDQVDLAACARKNGIIEGLGPVGEPTCVIRFTDGGKICRNPSDCQGGCMSYGNAKAGDESMGQCAAQAPERNGCSATVSNGIVGTRSCN